MNYHYLNNKWNVWAHLSNDNNWNIESYKNIIELDSIEKSCIFFENINNSMINNSMLFIMKNDIPPLWEDENNISGGSFSFKTNFKNIKTILKDICFMALGEILIKDEFSNIVNGITISPKKNFYIIKIWVCKCDNNDTEIINSIPNLFKTNCIFKKHIN